MILRVMAVALLFAASTFAAPLQDAIESRDVLALETLSRTATVAEEARLAQGAALSLRHQDEAALALLGPLSDAARPPLLRAGACRAMADVLLRQGRYRETRDVLRCTEQASGGPLQGELRQVLDYAEVLAAEPAMRLERPVQGRLAAHRDSAGLTRVSVTVNGDETAAVIDSDASFCVVSAAMASSLGIRVLDKPVTIITTARRDQPMRLGMAETLILGDAVFHHVVFAVLPDRAMQFRADYRMDVVIGLPLLVALGRVELAIADGHRTFTYGAPPPAAAGAPNMVLSGLDPFALVEDVRSGAVLRLAIDTAADTTTLNATALRQYPALADGARQSWAAWAGAGGNRSDTAALRLGDRVLIVGGVHRTVARLKALSEDEPDRHGAIGQDLLQQGWTLDFGAMRFDVSD